jgi:DNA processing protein
MQHPRPQRRDRQTMRGTSIGEKPTPASTEERAAWVALAGINGIGARRIAALISRFGSAAGVLHASQPELESVEGFSPRGAKAVQGADRRRAAAVVGAAESAGQLVLTPPDPAYPASLRSIPDPPPVLYVRGNVDLLARRAVAIVGSRNHTRYGAEVAARLAEEAVQAWALVVSGMALGLDAVAQAAALDANGTTIGVLGTGVDVVYPRENARLFDRVLGAGAVASEHPPGARGHRGAFPRRNRLISGLSAALVVVEAAEGSGTLITVDCALEQGREVFAVPGPITSPTSRGTNRLLRDGATPILEPGDLLRALGGASETHDAPVVAPCTLSTDEARVLNAFATEPVHVDDLAHQVGMPIGLLLGTLLGLELGGLVEQLPGGQFRRR